MKPKTDWIEYVSFSVRVQRVSMQSHTYSFLKI